MKHAKPMSMIFIMALIFCSYSVGQPSSGIGVKGTISNGVPGILGIINNGASVYPASEVSNAKVYLGGITGANIWRREFVCNSMSACGMYDAARANDGAIVNLGGFKRGATVPNIDGSAVRLVSVAKAKS
jgi:hypothetical protein